MLTVMTAPAHGGPPTCLAVLINASPGMFMVMNVIITTGVARSHFGFQSDDPVMSPNTSIHAD